MAIGGPLQKFLNALGSEPLRVRKSFLSTALSLTNAKNAYLLLPDEGGLLSWRKQQLPGDLSLLIKNFENGTRDLSSLGKVLLVRLKSQTRNSRAGVLILVFARRPTRSNARLRQAITPLCKIYMCWEAAQHFRNTIQMQQKALHSLSAESASVAQEYVRLTQQMQMNQQRLQSITKGMLRTQEEERAKISRDLHDGIGQELTALKMNLDILSPLLEDRLGPDNQERWREARTIAERSLQDVRELSRLLRPRMLDDLGLFPTLRWYTRSFTKRTKVPVVLELEGEEEKLPPEIQTILFRIVQEAFNNIAKHSQAQSAGVQLILRAEQVQLSIEDDGTGFSPDPQSVLTGSGLGGMRDRVSLYRGTFHVHSEQGKGTRLDISIPLE